MFRSRLKSFVRNLCARNAPATVPAPSAARTHQLQMNSPEVIDRSAYTLPLQPPSQEECERGREIAAQQLIEMQKDPEEWASFLDECELFATGYFSIDE